jgi:hypothetical protein
MNRLKTDSQLTGSPIILLYQKGEENSHAKNINRRKYDLSAQAGIVQFMRWVDS